MCEVKGEALASAICPGVEGTGRPDHTDPAGLCVLGRDPARDREQEEDDEGAAPRGDVLAPFGITVCEDKIAPADSR